MRLHASLIPALLASTLGAAFLLSETPAEPGPTPAGSETAPATEAPAAARFDIDPSHSWVLFRVKHLGVGMSYGWFNKLGGSYVLDTENPENSSVEMEIDAASVFTNDEGRDQHLRGPDFFNVKEFPKIRFTSTQVKGLGDGRYEIRGTLDLHGRKEEVAAQAQLIGQGKDPWGNHRSGFEATLRIDRLAYGISYMPEGIGTDVDVTISVEGIRK